MPVTRYKWGGGFTDIGNGKAYSKWGGGWFPVKLIRGKSGPVGSGGWVDGGFTGQPALPSVPWVSAWDYSNIIFNWNAGGGGAPISHYHYVLVRTNDGAWVANGTTTATSVMIGINWDNRYQFYVEAVGINGVATGWSNGDGSTQYGRPGIGHPRQDSYGYVWHSTPWQSGNLVNVNPQRNYLFRDEAWSVYLGNDILVKNVSWGNLNVDTNAVGGIVTTGFARTVNLHFAGVWQGWALDDGISYNEGIGDINILSGNAYAWYGLPITAQWGGDNWWGLGPRGEGWMPASDGRIQYTLRADSVNFSGDRYYQQYEVVSSIPESGNYWW
jgi:hypothetical protein